MPMASTRGVRISGSSSERRRYSSPNRRFITIGARTRIPTAIRIGCLRGVDGFPAASSRGIGPSTSAGVVPR